MTTLAVTAVGCSGTKEVQKPYDEARFALQKAKSCGDLEAMLKEDAAAKMNAQIDAIIKEIDESGYYGGGPWGPWEGDVDGGGSTGSGPVGGESPPGGGDDGAPGGSGAPPAHSDTNTQVAGVDEADIVKTDGNNLYLLHGQSLEILKSWPISDLGVASSTAVEGNPIEMFVADGKIVVYSQVDGSEIYSAAGVAPRAPYYEYGYAAEPAWDGMPNPYYSPLTKITVFDVSGGAPSVSKELYFEGNYASSRRVDAHVRTILSGGAYGPALSYYPEITGEYPDTAEEWKALFEDLRFKNTLAIYSSKVSDWLPNRFEKKNGQIEAIAPSCESYYMPPEASTGYGLVQVESFDLDALNAPIAETSVVGAVDTVYANESSLYLAARGWTDPMFSPGLTPEDTSSTYLHKFDLTADPAHPAYVASGSVAGHVRNQFSLDEKDGILRIATTRQLVSQTEWTSTNDVYALRQNGDELKEIGSVKDLAPGEQIYSARFVGDRAYVVTFRQVDPLFVIDFKNPQAPKVLAELKIPGFSEYMHPMDEGHLLTIGQDATAEGQVTGLALQVFDVVDAKNPKLLHKHVFSGQDYGYSEAAYNHKAFNWYEPLHLLAFPFQAYDAMGGMKTSLELFDVTVADGIKKRGAVDHTGFFQSDPYGYCGGYYGVGVRRGVFIDKYVYAISYGGVTASEVSNPSVPVVTLPLSAPPAPYADCGL
ncbi:beta-propeller domain-containing protein [Polyangium aurulentum]|uniref:beta-propeller domain-containing protein n=1 Tax=Polyangium aurulentum TaxID=2567896 RepID=UPI00146C401F|nr:beta-propeller domain-containing protein [Polyangium aurulentum]UQA60332.1 beta-propeller domain-containing protein [Polyangium aurulentum]